MFRRLLISLFFFAMLLSSQTLLQPSQVHAVLPWCGCGNCMMMYANPPKCTCGYPYYWCFEDLRALQLQATMHTSPADNNFIPEGRIPTIGRLDLAEQGIYLMSGGKCLNRKVALHLFGNAAHGLTFSPAQFGKNL
jgi:hypothetical protein